MKRIPITKACTGSWALPILTIFLLSHTGIAYMPSTQGARVPVFEPDFTTEWSGGTIHTDNRGVAPCVVDWDGDGRKDLLVGTFYNGNIYFYKNYGTNAVPSFDDRVMLEADGKVISLSYG